jgi:hypothetical protein
VEIDSKSQGRFASDDGRSHCAVWPGAPSPTSSFAYDSTWSQPTTWNCGYCYCYCFRYYYCCCCYCCCLNLRRSMTWSDCWSWSSSSSSMNDANDRDGSHEPVSSHRHDYCVSARLLRLVLNHGLVDKRNVVKVKAARTRN